MICLHNDSQLVSTVKESNAETFRAPNIRQTAGRLQYMCVVMTDRSEKEEKERIVTDPIDKMISEARTRNRAGCTTVQKRRQNACMTLTLGRCNKRMRVRISL